MWPFKKKTLDQTSGAKPPVDLNTPVTNPRLVAAIVRFAKKRGDPELKKLQIELRRANYLVAATANPDQWEGDREGQKITLKKETQFGILRGSTEDGKPIFFLFTDWDAIRKYYGDKPINTLVMPAKQAWPFVARDFNYAVINPAGPALPLQRPHIENLAKTSIDSA
ncbi:MAG: SseB family protein [Planctomycetota bacterium]